MRLKFNSLFIATLLALTTALIAAEPAAVTTYEESHPHPEYKLTYAALQDCHSADAGKVLIRKGICIWFKTPPKGDTQDARLENGSIHTVTVSDFYKISAGPPPGAASQPADAQTTDTKPAATE